MSPESRGVQFLWSGEAPVARSYFSRNYFQNLIDGINLADEPNEPFTNAGLDNTLRCEFLNFSTVFSRNFLYLV